MKQILVAWLMVLITLPALSQNREIEFEEYKLDNGLHVILHQDRTTPIVTVSVLYHVGSKNERKGRSGFAHFFEHLMFEGSPNINRGDYFKIIQAAGGQLNANTSYDRTYYYQTLPSNQLELGLYMESERMLHAKIDSAGIATQKEVVKEEKRLRVDNQPYGSMFSKLFANAFPGTAYEWSPIGSFEDIDASTSQDFVDFYNTYYVPNNATLTIAGDFDKAKAKKMVQDYFGEIKKGTKNISRPEVVVPKFKEEVRETVYDNIQLPGIMMGYRTPKQGTPDSYAMSMLSLLLTNGQSSRFQKNIVNGEDQLAAGAFAFSYPLELSGMFLIRAIANIGKDVDALETAIDDEIEKMKTQLISERELEKARNQIQSVFISSNGSVQGIAESLADYHVYYGDANLINTEIERYMKVTREDIQNAAKKYLNKDNRVVLTYLPKSEEEKAN